MSENQQPTIEQLKAHQQIKTPEQLAAKKKEMIEQIRSAEVSIQKEAVTRIACYSIDDAIEIAQHLNLKDGLGFLKGESEYVMHRHTNFFNALHARLESLAKNCSDPEISSKLHLSAHKTKIWSKPEDRVQVDIDAGVQKVIDGYYSVLISKRKGFRVAAPEANNVLTEAQQNVVDFMQTTHEVIKPHVPVSTVTRFLREIIAEDTGEDPRVINPWNDKDVELITNAYVKSENLNPYGLRMSSDSARNIVSYVSSVKRNLKRTENEITEEWDVLAGKSRYRPLDVVYNLRKEKVEKDLKSELVDKFKALGYDAEFFYDTEAQKTLVKLKALPEGVSKEQFVDWEKPPKREQWPLVKEGDIVQYKIEGRDGAILIINRAGHAIGHPVQFFIKGESFEKAEGEPIYAFDYKNDKLYTKTKDRNAINIRSLNDENEPIKDVLVLKEGETLKEFMVVEGKLVCLVGVKGGGEKLYVDGKDVDRAAGSERIILDKAFGVNGGLAYALKVGRNLQKVRVNGRTYYTQQFDIVPKGIVDIVPIGDGDFLAVGYLNKKPVAYTSQGKYELDAMQQSDSNNGIRSVSVSENKNGFTVVADYSDGEYIPFDKTEKRQGIRGLVDEKKFEGVSLAVSNVGDNTVLSFSVEKGPVTELLLDKKFYKYHFVQMVNGTPVLTLEYMQKQYGGGYAVVPLTEFMQGGIHQIKMSPQSQVSSASFPQVIDQYDRVVVITTEHSVVCTHEWKKESPEPLAQPDEEMVLGVNDLDKVTNDDSIRIDLQALNVLYTENEADVEAFYKEYRTVTKESKDPKGVLSRSISFIKNLNSMLASDPDIFLDTLSAHVDRTDNAYVDSIIRRLVPEYREEEKAKGNGIMKAIGKLIKALGFNKSSPKDYFGVQYESDMLGGDPSEGNKERLFSVKEDVTGGVYLTSTYFGFDNKSGMFTQLSLPIDNTPTGATTEMTGEILLGPHVGNTTVLPQRMGASIIPERVKIVYKDGSEEKITVEQGEDGHYFVRIKYDKKMKSLVWSQGVPDVPYIPSDISGREYEKAVKSVIPTEKAGREKFKRSFEDPIVTLPSEEVFFVQSIKDLSPKEKLYAIESYVHSVCYYDWDNGEVIDKKEGLAPQEQLSFMQVRCKDLAEKNKSLAASGKRYTGVCADFGVLTTALMRSSGLMAGVGLGAVLCDGVATVAQAHAVSVTPWPEGSNLQLTYIDGTPTEGLTREETQKLDAIRFPTLREREKLIEEIEERYKVNSNKMIKELEERLEAGEDFAIEKLQNGDLERMLNVVLKYGVEPEHVRVIEGLLNAVRYSGLPVFSEDINDQIGVKKFLEAEVKRERSLNIQMSPGGDSGTQLFDISREYVSQDGIDNLNKVIKLVEPYLHKTEHRALMLLVKYLKAEKMKR